MSQLHISFGCVAGILLSLWIGWGAPPAVEAQSTVAPIPSEPVPSEPIPSEPIPIEPIPIDRATSDRSHRLAVQQGLDALEVQASLDGPGKEAWREYLLVDRLREAIASEDAVDAKDIGAPVVRFAAAERTVSQQRLLGLSAAIDDWARQLSGLEASGAELLSTLDDLEAWLDSQPTQGNRWKRYLRLEKLREELAKEEDLDADVMAEVLDRLDSRRPGLRKARFARVRRLVRAWLSTHDEDSTVLEDVEDSLDQLTRWGARNRRLRSAWPKILKLDELSEEIEAGEDADPQVVQAVRDRLINEANVNRTAFARVRQALENWYRELASPAKSSLARTIRQRKGDYRTIDEVSLQASRSRLSQSLGELDRYLDGGTQDNKLAWRRYLKWDDLDQLLNDNGPSFQRLASISNQFSAGLEGMNKVLFVRAARSLRGYLHQLEISPDFRGQLDHRRRQLDRRLWDLEQELASLEEETAERWKGLLEWSTLPDRLADDSPTRDSLKPLRDQLANAMADDAGQLTSLPALEQAFELYVEQLRFRDRETGDDRFAGKLEALAKAVDEYDQDAAPQSAAQISAQLDWLDMTGQVSGLAASVRNRYGHPNLFVDIKSSVLEQRVDRQVNDTSPVSESLDGVQIRGTATTTALVSAHLLPSYDGAKMVIQLKGHTDSKTVGRQRRVMVCASGTTPICGEQTIIVQPSGLVASSPRAGASTNQNITGVNVNRRIGRKLITRVAKKKAHEALPKGEMTADNRARQRIREQMQEGSAELVAEANQKLRDKVVDPLKQKGLYPEKVNLQSSAEAVSLVAVMQFGGIRLGAPSMPPAINYESDIVGKIHESVVNNLLAEKIGGMYIDNETAEKMQQNEKPSAEAEAIENEPTLATTDGGEDEEDDDEEEEETFSLRLNRYQPATVQFRDHRIRVAFRPGELTRNGEAQRQRIEVFAEYTVLVHGPGNIELQREGEIGVDFLGHEGQLGVDQIAVKRFVVRKMKELFRPRWTLADLPAGDLAETIQKVDLQQLDFVDGWALFGMPADSLSMDF